MTLLSTMSKSTPISAFVICLNEERNIRRCLESLTWCSELIVIDSGSTDRTLEICKEFGAVVFYNKWNGFKVQKQFGLDRCKHEWCISLDADEEVSPELRDEIISTVNAPQRKDYNGFELLRVVFHLGKWWRKGGWYPEFRLRLVRKSATVWGGDDPHDHALVTGKIGRLKGELRHYTHTDLSDQIRSMNNFSSIAARSLRGRGGRFSLHKLILNPVARFLKFYILRKGYLEGVPGLIVGVLEGYYAFLKYAKLWEEQHARSESHPGK